MPRSFSSGSAPAEAGCAAGRGETASTTVVPPGGFRGSDLHLLPMMTRHGLLCARLVAAAQRRGGNPFSLCYPLMPAEEHTLAPTALHSADASMNLSLMTVEFMFCAVTQVGVSSDAGC